MKKFNRNLGAKGEQIAAEFLEGKGYRISKRNFFTKFGEIDLICIKDSLLIFVEVKLKVGEDFGSPEEMINPQKIKQVERIAGLFLLKNPEIKAKFLSYRLDAVCIVLGPAGEILRLNHYENLGF